VRGRARLTIRTRLTLLYGVTWLGAATLLLIGLSLAISTMPDYAFDNTTPTVTPSSSPQKPLPTPSDKSTVGEAQPGKTRPGETASPTARPFTTRHGGAPTSATPAVRSVADLQRYLFGFSAIGLLICGGIAVLTGWLVAGRMLTPIARITRTAGNIAAGNLHQRVALTGPRDEIKRLADTFDGMLARLDQAFTAQSRFAANASHELLTPLATARTILQTTPRGPKTETEIAALSTKLLTLNERSEHIVEALLTLANAGQSPVPYQPVNLAVLVAEGIDRIQAQAAEHDITIESAIHPALVSGNPVLCAHLADNLLSNAVRYNHPGGTIQVGLTTSPDGKVVLTVENTGPPVPADLVDHLFEPFVRGQGRNHRANGSGHGLGMAIVKAVAHAHSATVEAQANPTGGLTVTVVLPASSHDSGTRHQQTPGRKAPTASSSKPSPATRTASAIPKTKGFAPAPPPPDATADTSTPLNFEEP
jgi:signal transduction histidine kinase